MIIEKRRIVEILRSRGLHARADWVDRQLPEEVDTYDNASLLARLELTPAVLAAEQHEPEPAAPSTTEL